VGLPRYLTCRCKILTSRRSQLWKIHKALRSPLSLVSTTKNKITLHTKSIVITPTLLYSQSITPQLRCCHCPGWHASPLSFLWPPPRAVMLAKAVDVLIELEVHHAADTANATYSAAPAKAAVATRNGTFHSNWLIARTLLPQLSWKLIRRVRAVSLWTAIWSIWRWREIVRYGSSGLTSKC